MKSCWKALVTAERKGLKSEIKSKFGLLIAFVSNLSG